MSKMIVYFSEDIHIHRREPSVNREETSQGSRENFIKTVQHSIYASSKTQETVPAVK